MCHWSWIPSEDREEKKTKIRQNNWRYSRTHLIVGIVHVTAVCSQRMFSFLVFEFSNRDILFELKELCTYQSISNTEKLINSICWMRCWCCLFLLFALWIYFIFFSFHFVHAYVYYIVYSMNDESNGIESNDQNQALITLANCIVTSLNATQGTWWNVCYIPVYIFHSYWLKQYVARPPNCHELLSISWPHASAHI